MIGSSRNYAIGMAHFMIGGGWQMLAIVCGVYLLMFFGAVCLYYYIDITSPFRSGITSTIVSLLIALETAVLVLFGSFRVASAIRLDVSSKMIESHRLMPVPAWRAVMGYIFGSTTHATIFALVNVMLAFTFAGVTRTSLAEVAFNQAVLFVFALLIWTATALGTLMFRYLYYAVLIISFIGGCALVGVYFLLPGVALLVSPMIGETIFKFAGFSRATLYVFPASLASQGALIALFFVGACRRYRGTYVTTFSDVQALLVHLTWCFASLAGLALRAGIHPDFRSGPMDASLRGAQITASIALTMIISIVPLATLTAAHRPRKPPWFLYLPVIVLGMAIIPLGEVWTYNPFRFERPKDFMQDDKLVVTLLLLAAHTCVIFAALRLLQRVRPVIKWLVVGLGSLLYWMGPLILELVRMMIEASGKGGKQDFGVIGTLSPLGLLINTWNAEDHGASPIVGTVLQCLIAAALMTLMALYRPRAAAPAPIDHTPLMMTAPPVQAVSVTAIPPSDASP